MSDIEYGYRIRDYQKQKLVIDALRFYIENQEERIMAESPEQILMARDIIRGLKTQMDLRKTTRCEQIAKKIAESQLV